MRGHRYKAIADAMRIIALVSVRRSRGEGTGRGGLPQYEDIEELTCLQVDYRDSRRAATGNRMGSGWLWIGTAHADVDQFVFAIERGQIG